MDDKSAPKLDEPHPFELLEPGTEVVSFSQERTSPTHHGPYFTYVGFVNYQPLNDQPIGVELKFSERLEGGEQPYERRLKATTDYKRLDYGWVENPSWVVVRNTEGIFTQVQPTQQQRDEVAKRVLEIWVGCPPLPNSNPSYPALRLCSLLPGQSFPIRLDERCALWVRSEVECRYTLYAFPK